MNKKKLILLVLFGILFCEQSSILSSQSTTNHITPKITVVFIIDQFGYSYLTKYGVNLKYGLADLLKNGIVFHNALYPHAMPTTPTGHAAISTGSYANLHGYNSYGFVDGDNKFIEITDDNSPSAAVFKKDGTTYDFGKSPKYLMTDTVADKFILTSRSSSSPRSHEAVSFSLKPRASIPLAGNMGKAFWLDESCGTLTTSKFYFDKHPEWLSKFNKKNEIKDGSTFTWKPFYSASSLSYKYPQAFNYQFSSVKPEKQCIKKFKINYSAPNPMGAYSRSPFSSELLFSAARSYIRSKSDKQLLVYISLSNFDFLGHLVGPDNFDQIDLLYHLDWQIGKFITFVENYFSSKRSFFIFTSDHGTSQIPEIQNKQGFKASKRIDAKLIINEINASVEREFGYKNIIQHFESPQIFLDRKIIDKISEIKKGQLYQKIKDVLYDYECILDVWSELDFEKGTCCGLKNHDYRALFLKQYVRGRSGHIMFLTYPNQMITLLTISR
jgi:predicted AlkP superfamily pyrophosphatase or phosphodiesterase